MIRSDQLTGFHQPESRRFTLRRFNQVLLVGLVIGAVVFCARPTLASDDDAIDTVSSDGDHIFMQSVKSTSRTILALPRHGNLVTTWITPDDTIVNTDEGGESVDGTEE